jgi:hypothetical protein
MWPPKTRPRLLPLILPRTPPPSLDPSHLLIAGFCRMLGPNHSVLQQLVPPLPDHNRHSIYANHAMRVSALSRQLPSSSIFTTSSSFSWRSITLQAPPSMTTAQQLASLALGRSQGLPANDQSTLASPNQQQGFATSFDINSSLVKRLCETFKIEKGRLSIVPIEWKSESGSDAHPLSHRLVAGAHESDREEKSGHPCVYKCDGAYARRDLQRPAHVCCENASNGSSLI